MLSIVWEELGARNSWSSIIRSFLLAKVVHFHVLSSGLNFSKVNSSTLDSLLIFTQPGCLLLLLFRKSIALLLFHLLFLIIVHLAFIIIKIVGCCCSVSNTSLIIYVWINTGWGIASLRGNISSAAPYTWDLYFFWGIFDWIVGRFLFLHVEVDDHIESVCVALSRKELLVAFLTTWLS